MEDTNVFKNGSVFHSHSDAGCLLASRFEPQVRRILQSCSRLRSLFGDFRLVLGSYLGAGRMARNVLPVALVTVSAQGGKCLER
jgi:hypothetical protein